MSEYEANRTPSPAGGFAELWYDPASAPDTLVYRPAVFMECLVSFRSLKAGISHSDERPYTAWLPDRELPVDWDTQAVEAIDLARVSEQPSPGVRPAPEPPSLTAERFQEIETDLIDSLARRERLVVLYNPLFQIFSGVAEPIEDFLARAGEAALASLETELKQLKQTFELRLEQVREAQARQTKPEADPGAQDSGDSKGEIERLLIKRTEFFEAEHRLASLFTGIAGLFFSIPTLEDRSSGERPGTTAELHEDLIRLEQEASTALNDLYTRYLDMVRSYDEFAIGIQPNNVKVLRRALLWVPVPEA